VKVEHYSKTSMVKFEHLSKEVEQWKEKEKDRIDWHKAKSKS
jgi:hypothetical protein